MKVGGAHLDEGEQEADGEVADPVDGSRHREGGRSVRLFEQLPRQDERDPS